MATDEHRKTMPLEVLSYERILAADSDEIQKMVRILSNEGLFFLDMAGPTSEDFLADLAPVYRHQRNFFERTAEEKMKYHSGIYYKGFYTFDTGVEKIHLGREEKVQNTLDLPTDLHPVSEKVASTSDFIDNVLRELGTAVCKSMDPPVPAALDDPGNPGLSNLYLAISKVKPGSFIMPSHLDDGFLTLTFYDEPFLEVLDRTTQEWKLVEVNKNMPIVNAGEELQRNSNDRLYAPLHRCYQGPNEIDLIMFDLFESPRAKI
ncbi:hypothetical protein PFICI_10846 [Pestalotiopsis fici W106-1]|uniref:Isopenicillin N synthase-like Fe(2+) 2OG dioxygenase domain-containing protein n=1 Tax=Pestalotiopsis fici (strain W106-1 / CGMCC3.15140) TaxID=1229662 RepID=W3WV03_PESFW|nr:uncharacterized protein PFICI_10846 [Pestalotiopsis fici W106-1]ETS76972.1 hypothetical protein PFICI_10846 [Pestalotiopsis fici W106-1]